MISILNHADAFHNHRQLTILLCVNDCSKPMLHDDVEMSRSVDDLIASVLHMDDCLYRKWKKRSEEMQILLHASCSKVEPKIFAPLQTPFLGVQDGLNLISWRWSLPLPTNPVWWGSMHAISCGNNFVVTDPPTNTPTHTHTHKQTGPITIHYTTASTQCNEAWMLLWKVWIILMWVSRLMTFSIVIIASFE